MITFRQLPADEWFKLKPIYEANLDVAPSADSNIVLVAEEDGQIVGIHGINFVVHAGPAWVSPEKRKQGIATELGLRVMAVLQGLGAPGFVMFPSNLMSEALAMKMGLEPMPVKVFKKEF